MWCMCFAVWTGDVISKTHNAADSRNVSVSFVHKYPTKTFLPLSHLLLLLLLEDFVKCVITKRKNGVPNVRVSGIVHDITKQEIGKQVIRLSVAKKEIEKKTFVVCKTFRKIFFSFPSSKSKQRKREI